jgi:hypothetical protein
MTSLTLEEQATNYDTMKHIRRVEELLHFFVKELLDRADEHDQTKLESPEVEAFTEFTNKLSGMTYGSEEYKATLEEMKPCLDHHYAHNRHHPQHFKNGIDDMNLLDLLEMFADWRASSERHNDGNIRKSIEHNGVRFNMSPQLVKIFENTADIL